MNQAQLGVYAPIPTTGNPTITIARNRVRASWIDSPVIADI